jgi:uncharacterized protein YdeI (YjbR/CyaY-like superfamily)
MSTRLTEALEFPSPQAMRDWLTANHATAKELWVALHKVHTAKPSITWEEGVREALCFGWIDAVKKGGTDIWYQRFTPRGPRSGWSDRNRKHVEDLIAKGLMMPAGLAQVDKAKADGRWDAAYAGQKDMVIPADFLAALAKAPPLARSTYDGLKRQNLFAIYYRVTSAKKPETRARRIEALIATLATGETFH